MSLTSKWIVPCSISDDDNSLETIRFNLTEQIRKILSNKVWNRKFQYGNGSALEKISPETILGCSVTIYPKFNSGYIDENRVIKIVEKQSTHIPDHLNSYKDWNYRFGCAIITVNSALTVDKIPSGKGDYLNRPEEITEEFLTIYHQHGALIEEVSSFFLAALHLSFPTKTLTISDGNNLYDGIYLMEANDTVFGDRRISTEYLHNVLIEKKKLENLKSNIDALSEVWHYDLWPLQRYLVAVNTDRLSMDQLLDLLFALEGMFSKNTSSEFIKTMCLIHLCKNRKEAEELRNLLKIAFRIRNDIAHGERSYTPFDTVKIGGKETIAQEVYWQMKSRVAAMLTIAISKTLTQPNLKKLNFSEQDLLEKLFKN